MLFLGVLCPPSNIHTPPSRWGKTLSVADCPVIFVMGTWWAWELGEGIALAKAQCFDCFMKSCFPSCPDPVQLLGNYVRCICEKSTVKAEVMQRNFLVITPLWWYWTDFLLLKEKHSWNKRIIHNKYILPWQ